MRYDGIIYKTPDVPCKGCTKRQIGCHGSCEEYQKGVAKWIEKRRQQKINKAVDAGIRRYQIDQVEKVRRKK